MFTNNPPLIIFESLQCRLHLHPTSWKSFNIILPFRQMSSKWFLSSSSPTRVLSQIFATHPTHRLELFSILEVMDSNLEPQAGYPDSGLSWSYLDIPSKYQANNLKQVINNCFLFLSNSLSIDNPKIRCHTS